MENLQDAAQSPIAREGYPFIAAGLALTFLAWFFHLYVVTGILAGLTAFVVFFFRDPRRQKTQGDDLVIAPADGSIFVIEEVEHNGAPWRKVSIFLTVFNVHVNRAPIAGAVSERKYTPGKYLVANHPKSSELNEQASFTISNGRMSVSVKQIAGLIARRIVCRVKDGDLVKQGERFGLIRFGSRTDLLLPLACKVKVAIGDKVVGGETVIAEYEAAAQ